jgi:aspartate/methionine/tyrosine aminotransferase
MIPFADRIQSLGTENAFKLGDDIARCEQSGIKVIKLNLGEPDFDSAENINQAAIEHINNGNSHYTNPQGILPLRESIARQIYESRSVKVDPQQIVVTTGGKPGISYTIMAYVNPGDEVIYPSPGFPIYESWVTFLGAVPVPLHLEEDRGFRFNADDLEGLISPKTKVLILNSPSNPTGGVLTREDLEGIAQVVKEKADPNIRIYADEIYEHIIFDGHQHQSLLSIPGMVEHTILASGHSKSYAMTGWRLGYAVLPSVEEAMVFRQMNINIISCTPPFIQEAGRAAIENQENKKNVRAMVAEFEQRRDVVVEGLNQIEGIHCNKPEGAFYVFPNIAGVCEALGVLAAYEQLSAEIRQQTSPSTLFQMFALYHHGVATMDRRSFGAIGSEGKHYLRLSTATDMESLKEGIRRIETASKDIEGFRKYIDTSN